jgi:uncharacterized protein with von Willebrand factor type A (vWA) domain
MWLAIRKLYVKFKLTNIQKNQEFYGKIRNFFKMFTQTKLYEELRKLDPYEATKIILELWKPPPPQPKGKQGKGDGKGDGKGISADKGSIPIDIRGVQNDLPQIEKLLDAGLNMDDVLGDEMRDQFGQLAGTGAGVKVLRKLRDILDEIGSHLYNKNLDVFDLARKLEQTEKYDVQEEVKDTKTPENEMTVSRIKQFTDILGMLPTELMYDDDVFYSRIGRKETRIKQYQHRRKKKQALYLLVDCSGSMGGSKEMFASALVLAMLKKAVDGEAKYFIRYFDTFIYRMMTATNKKQAKKVIQKVLSEQYQGGGTDIKGAIMKAVEDIAKDKEKFEKVDILCITDGENNFDLDRKELEGAILHSFLIGNYDNMSLKKCSDTYQLYTVNDMKELVRK